MVLTAAVQAQAPTPPSAAATQTAQGAPARERSGEELYRAACATCHGPDGKGAPQSVVGFDTPLPDFTDCSFATPEADPDWTAIVHQGGPVRAFDRMMPAFGDALTVEEIGRVLDHVRGFCAERGWPRGDLNLPRALVTEKAFPENEAVLTTSALFGGPAASTGAVGNVFLYEHRLGSRGQYEVVVPFNLQEGATGTWSRGLGDVALAYKHALFDSFNRGSIVSAGAEMKFPTGKEQSGLGGGATIFEPFVTASQILPRDGFFHLHGGLEFPIATSGADNEAFWRAAVGKTFVSNRFGRSWSPMVELLGARELGAGHENEWDLLPEMQISLSTRQHILLNVGVRVPVTERDTRSKTFMVYLLWDWFDGGLFEGW
jgi:mono/diheme cytochrome c family protein